MALRDLSVPAMLHLSAPWVDPKRDRKMLSSIPILTTILPVLDEAHQGLLETQTNDDANANEIHAISEQQLALDRTHDKRARGIYNLLDALVDLVDDGAKNAQCVELKGTLCPNGIAFTQKSYAEESGNALLTAQRITKKQWKELAGIKVFGVALDAKVEEWLESAKKLGALETEKVKLQNQLVEEQGSHVRQADVLAARNRWIGVVRSIEQLLHVGGVDQAVIDEIMIPVQQAEAKAARGGSTSDHSTGNGATQPAPTSPAPEAPAAPPSAPVAPASPAAATDTAIAPAVVRITHG